MITTPLLIVFRAVSGLNVHGWIGERRDDANITNGVLAVALVQMLFINDLYVLMTWTSYFRYPKSYIIPVVIFLLIVAIDYWWLVIEGRGTDFIKRYSSEAPARKWASATLTCLLVVILLVGFFTLRSGQ